MNDIGMTPAPVTLLIGPEDFIAERTVQQIRRAALALDAQTELVEQSAAEVGVGELSGLLAPSLFSAARVLVLEQAADASAELGTELLSYAVDPVPDMQVVVVHGGGPKGRNWADKLRKLKSVRTVACDRLKPRDLPVFVNAEIRTAGGRAEPDVATALVEAVGADLRTLASASSQLVADSGDGYVTADLVQRYFAGRAEVTSFAVADAALLGRTAESLERLRWALGSGVAPVLVTSALAASVRRLVKVQGLPAGIKANDAAAMVGVPGWKVDQLRREAREWTSGGLATAVSAVAKADADVKGAALDPDYALEQAVLTISRARRSPVRR